MKRNAYKMRGFRIPRGTTSDALSERNFVQANESRIADGRDGRTDLGILTGRALAEAYEVEHDDERVFEQNDKVGWVPFPT